ncbi:hypothetical protein CBER1_08072 [Cercospora berteroae]|uniref:Cell wall protein PhiA n=1 Tax=Cercospora berteroae TaxID=357750 RepID=A0A2S6CF94_9PEZI|nr:hypothetical protein CBER1_08072 [Cercospora berteroae]
MMSFIVAAFAASAAAQAATNLPIRYSGTGLDASGVTCGPPNRDPKSVVRVSNDKNNKTTLFYYAPADGTLKLDSSNNGQNVYVAVDGALGFAWYPDLPKDGVTVGFSNGNGDVLTFEGKEWLSCPVEGEQAWQLIAQSRSSRTDCVGTTFKLKQEKEPYEGGPSGAAEYI